MAHTHDGQQDFPGVIDSTPEYTTSPRAVLLRSRRDFSLVVSSLVNRAAELRKLAKSNAGEGYEREGRAIAADIAAIETEILPAFQQQRELPIATLEGLETRVEALVRWRVSSAFDQLDDSEREWTTAQIAERRDKLRSDLSHAVAIYALSLAEHAFAAGMHARNFTPEALAVAAVDALQVL